MVSASDRIKEGAAGPLLFLFFIPHLLIPSLKIKSFIYQLQDYKIKQLLRSKTDLLILDVDELREYGANPVMLKQAVTATGIKRRAVLSYISIGEAEDYRDYWQDWWKPGNPPWLEEENPDWPGNYPVKFWYRGWQDIILERVEKIMREGYDGLYLDRVDVYERYLDEHPDADRWMVDFVKKITKRCRQINPSCIIVPQNAEELLLFDDYLEKINGIGKEELWYMEGKENPPEEVDRTAALLDMVLKKGGFVLVVEYVKDREKIMKVLLNSWERGYVPFITSKALDSSYLYLFPPFLR